MYRSQCREKGGGGGGGLGRGDTVCWAPESLSRKLRHREGKKGSPRIDTKSKKRFGKRKLKGEVEIDKLPNVYSSEREAFCILNGKIKEVTSSSADGKTLLGRGSWTGL